MSGGADLYPPFQDLAEPCRGGPEEMEVTLLRLAQWGENVVL